jgi:hypothetical protein
VNAVVPEAPTIDSVTPGDGQVAVEYLPGNSGGSVVTSFTVISDPGGFTASGLTSPRIVTGLTNGVSYTFTVTATNSAGTSSPSAPSAAVIPKESQTITFSNPGAQNFGTTPTLSATVSSGLTPTFSSLTTNVCTSSSGGSLVFLTTGTCTIEADQAGDGAHLAAAPVSQSFAVDAVVPGAPTIGSASAGEGQATVTFTPPSFDGGQTVTSYSVTSNPGGLTASGTSSPITVNGLTGGTPYTFTVRATNAVGTGNPSTASNSVTVVSPDSDHDGVTDEQEAADGTDPHDPDSTIEHADGEYCLDWNGFLSSLSQIAEFRNASSAPVGLRVELRDYNGETHFSNSFILDAAEQRDFIVNGLDGFVPDTYGTICAIVTGGAGDGLDAQLSVYAMNGASFDFAYSVSYSIARPGTQYVGYNNFYPSLNAFELANPRYGFVQIVNEETSAQTGELVYYDSEGTELRRISLEIPALSRRDVDTHTLGLDTSGLAIWSPSDNEAKFRVVLDRYFYDSAGRLIAAAAVPAKRGNGAEMTAAFDSTTKLPVLELNSAVDTATHVDVTVFNAAGEQLPSSGAPSVSLDLPAHGTRHIVLSQFLPNGAGSVRVKSSTASSLVSELMEYGLNSGLGLTFVSNTTPETAVGTSLRTSYNNYLGGCTLRLANRSAGDQSVALRMTRYNGTVLPLASPVTVAANGTLAVDVCGAETEPAYGELLITPTSTGTIVGDLIRKNFGSSSEFHLPLTER